MKIKRKALPFFIVAILLFSQTASHAFTTSGVITAAETWSGTIFLTGDVTISANGRLTIMPGTVVQCDVGADDRIGGADNSRIELIVEDGGSLSAIGTESQPILFTSAPFSPKSQNRADWYGIRINSDAVTLRYCTMEWADYALTIGDLPRAGFYPKVEQCVFQDNRSFGLFVTPSGLTLPGCIFRRNGTGLSNSNPAPDNFAIELVDCLAADCDINGITLTGLVDANLTFRRTTLRNNHSHGLLAIGQTGTLTLNGCVVTTNGIVGVEATGGGNLSVNVIDSLVSDNGPVGSLGNGYLGGLLLQANTLTITNCVVSNNWPWGINMYFGGTAPFMASVLNCTIMNNGTGMSMYDNVGGGADFSIASNRIQGNTIGIELAGGSPQTTATLTNNSILQSLGYEAKSGPFPVIADGNYWGEPTTAELQTGVRNLTKIYDSRDDANSGQIVIRNWLNTPADASIAPSIVRAPASQVVYAGNDVTLAVLANGSGTLNYQWFRDGKPIQTATAASLLLSTVTASDSGDYTVKVFNAAGSITTGSATLIVKPISEAALLSIQTFAAIAVIGEVGKTYVIQYITSSDAAATWTSWTTIATIKLPSTPFVYVDPTSGAVNGRIYRAVLQR
jgi:hypothetical protein